MAGLISSSRPNSSVSIALHASFATLCREHMHVDIELVKDTIKDSENKEL